MASVWCKSASNVPPLQRSHFHTCHGQARLLSLALHNFNNGSHGRFQSSTFKPPDLSEVVRRCGRTCHVFFSQNFLQWTLETQCFEYGRPTALHYPTDASDFGGLEVACWPLVPKFSGSNPAEAVGFFRAEKILSTPSFGWEVKPFVPCRRFTACKRSLNVTWKSGIFR